MDEGGTASQLFSQSLCDPGEVSCGIEGSSNQGLIPQGLLDPAEDGGGWGGTDFPV